MNVVTAFALGLVIGSMPIVIVLAWLTKREIKRNGRD